MTKTCKEYSEALFALALEEDMAQQFSTALKSVCEVFNNDPEYIDFLACYSIPVAERTQALESAFSGTLPVHVLSFLQILCEHGEIKSFFDCVDIYEALYSQHRKLSTAVVVSAKPLDDSQKQALVKKLEKLCGTAVRLECKTDESVLGGLIIEVDGKVIDGSLKRRLYEVKEVIDK